MSSFTGQMSKPAVTTASQSQTGLTTGAGSQSQGLTSSARGGPAKRRRTRMITEKKIADDEFMAAAIGDVEWLKQSLRDLGGQINFDKNGLAPIHLAAIHGRLECIKLCIEKFKVDINLASTTGWRAVHLVISNQTGKRAEQCLSYLLEKGADPSVVNDDGITPVHQAASEGHVQCLKLLIEIGAKIDRKDCRGNTPLDLAKLWGHRKCARILAAEMWHQDKDHVAKEMKQLKKLKMQQVLKELEEDEEFKAAQQFYGDIAFKNWLKKRHLEERPTQLPSEKKEEQERIPPQRRGRGMKPNSMSSSSSGSKGTQQMATSASSKSQQQPPASSLTMSGKDAHLSLVLENVGEPSSQEPTERKKKVKWKATPPYSNPNPWVKYKKLPKDGYVSILKDDYPRDEFTMMPALKGAPKYYDGRFSHRFTTEELDDAKAGDGREPDLPDEIVKKVMSKDPSLNERPFIFKTKHIFDVHKKHKLNPDERPRSEVPLHLIDDTRSDLFQLSLASKDVLQGTSCLGQWSDWRNDPNSLSAMAFGLKYLSRPEHFPSIPRPEYEINLGDLKGV